MKQESGVVPEIEGMIQSEYYYAEYYHFNGKPVVETSFDFMIFHDDAWWIVDEDGYLEDLVEIH